MGLRTCQLSKRDYNSVASAVQWGDAPTSLYSSGLLPACVTSMYWHIFGPLQNHMACLFSPPWNPGSPPLPHWIQARASAHPGPSAQGHRGFLQLPPLGGWRPKDEEILGWIFSLTNYGNQRQLCFAHRTYWLGVDHVLYSLGNLSGFRSCGWPSSDKLSPKVFFWHPGSMYKYHCININAAGESSMTAWAKKCWRSACVWISKSRRSSLGSAGACHVTLAADPSLGW